MQALIRIEPLLTIISDSGSALIPAHKRHSPDLGLGN